MLTGRLGRTVVCGLGLAVTSTVGLLSGCSEPNAVANEGKPGEADVDAAANEGGAADAGEGGATGDGGMPPAPKPVAIGPEINLANGGPIATYGAWKDKVVYVVFDTTAKTYRVELTRAAGGAPKVLFQGNIERFETYMFSSGSADVARDVLVPGTATEDGTFVVAIPTAPSGYAIHAIDAASETTKKIDDVPYIGSFTQRNGVVFYWYAQTPYLSTAYSGPSALAWRAPNGTITRVPQAWRTPDNVVQVSQDRSKVAYLADVPTNNPLPPFSNAALTLANADGTSATKLANGASKSFLFTGSSLVYVDAAIQSVTLGAAPKEIFRPNAASKNIDWWFDTDTVVVREMGGANMISVAPLAGGKATVGIVDGAVRTGKRVFYVPFGTTDLAIADAAVPLVPKFTVPDVVKPFVTADGRWAALLRGPDTATKIDRVWADGKVVDLLDKSIGHYDTLYGSNTIASGKAACFNTLFDAICVSDTGVVTKVRSNGPDFVAPVGSNGLLYTSYPPSERKPSKATVIVHGAALTATELSNAAVGTIRVSDSAIFYVVSNGASATLAARTTQ